MGRLAPSPTGALHLGHARTFLIAWWDVRSRGGTMLLRVEDLDEGRIVPGATERCLEDLAWLGLDWDGEPVLQSADVAPLEAAVAKLEGGGFVYPCVCSRRDIRLALSAPHADTGETPYPGTCRDRWRSAAEAERESGAPAGLRFRVGSGPLRLDDGFLGPFSSDVPAECGDFLVARRLGGYAYQLAVVVDDARMGVTDVHRGDDLLGSSGRQWLLQEALGLPHPRWVHLPLVLDAGGRRLAKRTGGFTLAALRERGVDPRAVVAWVARSAGHDAGPRAAPGDLVSRFDLASVPREPVRLGERLPF